MRRRLAFLVPFLLVVAFATGAGNAPAADYLTTCPDMPPDLVSATDDAIETREQGQRDVTICLALAERAETLVALIEESADSETTTAAQRVSLAPADRRRLDLVWWGVFFVGGIGLAGLVLPAWHRAFPWGRTAQ